MPRVTWWCQGRRFLGWISETLCMLSVVHTGYEECDIWRIHHMIVPWHHHHGSNCSSHVKASWLMTVLWDWCIDHRGCTATTTSVPRLRPRGDSDGSTRCGVSPCPVHPLDEPVLVEVGEQEKHRETGMKHLTSNIQIDFTSFQFLMFWRYGTVEVVLLAEIRAVCQAARCRCLCRASSTVGSFSNSDGESHSGAVTSTRWNLGY